MEKFELQYESRKPDPALSGFVESFWMLANHTDIEKEVVVLPDGRCDLSFSYSADEPFHVMLFGLETEPSYSTIRPRSIIFAVSFKLPALEYVLGTGIADILNTVRMLPAGFWNISVEDLQDFDGFCDKTSRVLTNLLKSDVDTRKLELFELIYATQGAMSVQEMSERVHWSSRQMNRYFTQWFGLSLKAYCNILRYRASFTQIREGKLFPEQEFADQAHFIRDVKKYSGVTPRELSKNKNDRFIQFSTLPKA